MKGRNASLPKNLFVYDFINLAKKESHARTRQRFLALEYLKEGATITETSKTFKISRNTIHQWLKRLDSEGIQGLIEKNGRGAHLKLHLSQHEIFKLAILELQENRIGGCISGSDVLKLMKEKFDITCCLATAYNSLARVDLVWISGRSVHPKTDFEAQDSFKKSSKKA